MACLARGGKAKSGHLLGFFWWVFLLPTPAGGLSQSKIYWTDFLGNTIQRANLADGSEVETLMSGLDRPSGLVIDAARCSIYWREEGKIMQADLDGTGKRELLSVTAPTPDSLLLVGDTLYWSDSSADKVLRAHLDDVSNVASHTLGHNMDANGFIVDAMHDPPRLFYVDYDVVYRSEWGGVVDETWGEFIEARDLTMDPVERRIYWTDNYEYAVMSADMDVLSSPTAYIVTDQILPGALVVDAVGRRMYFTTNGQKITASALDGTLGWTLSLPGAQVRGIARLDVAAARDSGCLINTTMTTKTTTMPASTTDEGWLGILR